MLLLIYQLHEKFNHVHIRKVEIWTFSIVSYSILCSITPLHVNIKIEKTILNLIYIFDYFLFNHTK